MNSAHARYGSDRGVIKAENQALRGTRLVPR
jgi:hypothetical protein